MIVAPIPDTPAEKAGIRSGDVILKVNGESIEGFSLLESVMKIRGPRGSIVKLEIQHLFADETEIIEITRGIIQISSVNMNITDENFAYIKLSVFYENTTHELSEILEKAIKQNVKGIILDLRNNPGGLLTASVEVASHFISDGLVLYEIDGSGRKTNWGTRDVKVFTDLPMVILSNEFSASGSEVVIGTLQDHKRATIVGETTFGKGSVNMIRSLSNGGGLYITFARWYTPSGRLIEGEGLSPDILVAQSQNQREDAQFEKGIQVLLGMISTEPQ
jgi:carboxyl-terminal processing protease